jgi:hypothetical protein
LSSARGVKNALSHRAAAALSFLLVYQSMRHVGFKAF